MEKVRIRVKHSRQFRLSKVVSNTSQPVPWLPVNVSSIKLNSNVMRLKIVTKVAGI